MDIKKDTIFIIKKKLKQVCYNLYQVHLKFEDEIFFEIGEGIEFTGKNGAIKKWSYTDGRVCFSINSLLELSVEKAQVVERYNLTLVFENEEKLQMLSGEDDAESYVVYHKKDFQVI